MLEKFCNTAYEPLIRDLAFQPLGLLTWRLIPIPTYLDTIVMDSLCKRYWLVADFQCKVLHICLLRAIPWAHKLHSRGAVHVLNWLKITLSRANVAVKDEQ